MQKRTFVTATIVTIIATLGTLTAFATGINPEGAIESVKQGVDTATTAINSIIGYIGLGTGGVSLITFLIVLKLAKKILKIVLFLAIIGIIVGIYFLAK